MAIGGRAEIVASVDISEPAAEVLKRNVSHPVFVRELDSLSDGWYAQWEADIWWASPPCQPFTRRGRQRDIDDPRARPLLGLIARIARLRPPAVAIENVPGFEQSRAHALLHRVLKQAGYSIGEWILCPSELGGPNRRRRYYCVASREPLLPVPDPEHVRHHRTLCSYIDNEIDLHMTKGRPYDALHVEPAVLERYRQAVHVVDRRDNAAVTNCFTSAYGRSHVRSGSLLRFDGGVRRFAPREILALLGFPKEYVLPEQLDTAILWRLAGNSLSIDAVGYVSRALLGDENLTS